MSLGTLSMSLEMLETRVRFKVAATNGFSNSNTALAVARMRINPNAIVAKTHLKFLF